MGKTTSQSEKPFINKCIICLIRNCLLPLRVVSKRLNCCYIGVGLGADEGKMGLGLFPTETKPLLTGRHQCCPILKCIPSCRLYAHFPPSLRDEEAEAWRFWLSSQLREAAEMGSISTAGFQLLTTTTE